MRGPDVASDPTEPMFATPDFSKTTHFARKKGLSDTLTVILFFCFGVVRFSRTCQLRENLVRFREEKKIFFSFIALFSPGIKSRLLNKAVTAAAAS